MGRGHACHDTYRNFQELILSFHHMGPGGLNSGHQVSDGCLDPLSHLSGLVMGSDCFLVSHLRGMCRERPQREGGHSHGNGRRRKVEPCTSRAAQPQAEHRSLPP